MDPAIDETHVPIRLHVSGAMLSHPRLVRHSNEDVVAYCLPHRRDPSASRGVLALIADGMGGHAAGEIASRIATQTVHRLYYELDGSPPDVLAASFAAANQAIYERSQQDPGCAGMGTTCTVLAIRDDRAFLAHLGDSRAYILRDGRLRQLSEDHSLVAALVRNGTISASEASTSPDRNVILQALGTRSSVQPLIWQAGQQLHPGDRLVLCSDGLSDLVNDDVIRETVAQLAPLDACRSLVALALAGGGSDNISVGVFAIGEASPKSDVAPRATRKIQLARSLDSQS